ncbi:MAG: UDP-N-acetylmuramoyl-tripeptide--D-alanyl-D-alanine ligase [Deltaproteobacteria bacterium]|nr:UDP-N-acetylmuramoyl-tripeptide--D-alanyl-D-alanine ligase [Deltaproteobacteria bacterium]
MMIAENKNSKSTRDMSWETVDILEAANGTILQGDKGLSFSGISIDSRTIKKDELFIAIKGDVYDGHHFLKEVTNKGIHGFVINAHMSESINLNEYKTKEIVFISVNDTFRALGDLAGYKRKNSDVFVVGITGSNGKTSTREMTASIMSQHFNTLTTSGNFNNEIGLPLTLFKLNDSHEWAILEMAMNKPGEIKRLSEICLPDIGVITNIGPAHLEGLGSIEGVMHAKGELLETLTPHGTAILNADDPMTPTLAIKTEADILLFGLSEKADIRADKIKETNHGTHFTLTLPSQQVPIDLKVPGSFMVSNALAAAAVGHLLKLSPDTIKKGLENFIPVPGRMNILTTKNNIHIIDDTYNSNPGSMAAAIHTLNALRKGHRAVIVAGDMCELGDASQLSHKQIGSLSGQSNIDKLYITGAFAKDMAAGAREADMDEKNIFIGNKDDIIHHLIDWLKPDDWILVKGSRAIGMETVVTGIKNHFKIK